MPLVERRPGRRPDRPLRRARARLQRRARVPARGRRAPSPTRCATPTCSPACGAATRRSASSWSSATASTRRARWRSSPGRSRERLRAILAAEDCDIWQVDGGVLRCLASVDSRGWDADEVGSERELAAYEATVAALAANEPMVVGDLDAHGPERGARWRPTGAGASAAWSRCRWSWSGRPIGLIDVFDTRVRDYTVHLDLIRNVGRLLAGSFEKAMLVERLEGGNRDLRLLVDSGMEFGATLDVDAVLRTVARAHPRGLGGRPVRRLRPGRRRGRDPRLASAADCGRGPRRQRLPADEYGTFTRGGGDSGGRSSCWTS